MGIDFVLKLPLFWFWLSFLFLCFTKRWCSLGLCLAMIYCTSWYLDGYFCSNTNVWWSQGSPWLTVLGAFQSWKGIAGSEERECSYSTPTSPEKVPNIDYAVRSIDSIRDIAQYFSWGTIYDWPGMRFKSGTSPHARRTNLLQYEVSMSFCSNFTAFSTGVLRKENLVVPRIRQDIWKIVRLAICYSTLRQHIVFASDWSNIVRYFWENTPQPWPETWHR